MYLNKHACRLCIHFEIIKNLKPPVARKLAVRHISFVCLTARLLATGSFVKLFHKIPWLFHVYSPFSNSMIFPCLEHFLVIFQDFHGFQSSWEPFYMYFTGFIHSLKMPIIFAHSSQIIFVIWEGQREKSFPKDHCWQPSTDLVKINMQWSLGLIFLSAYLIHSEPVHESFVLITTCV